MGCVAALFRALPGAGEKGGGGGFPQAVHTLRPKDIGSGGRGVPEFLHDAQSIVPIGIDFHGLAMSGRRQDLSHPHIHPCHLIQLFSCHDQSVLVHPDAKVRSVSIPVHNLRHGLPCAFHEDHILRPPIIFIDGQNEQQ